LYSVCVFCFFFYLTVLIACMICFYYNVCDCHAFIKGNLLTYLLRSVATLQCKCGASTSSARLLSLSPLPALQQAALNNAAIRPSFVSPSVCLSATTPRSKTVHSKITVTLIGDPMLEVGSGLNGKKAFAWWLHRCQTAIGGRTHIVASRDILFISPTSAVRYDNRPMCEYQCKASTRGRTHRFSAKSLTSNEL